LNEPQTKRAKKMLFLFVKRNGANHAGSIRFLLIENRSAKPLCARHYAESRRANVGRREKHRQPRDTACKCTSSVRATCLPAALQEKMSGVLIARATTDVAVIELTIKEG